MMKFIKILIKKKAKSIYVNPLSTIPELLG